MLLVSCSEAYEMTTHIDHHNENSQLSFCLATTDNAVNYVLSCNYTSITNTCLSQHRGGCWKQTVMKKLEDVENILWALSTGVMHLLPESALWHTWTLLSCLPVGTVIALRHWRAAILRMHSLRAPVFTWCKDQNYILPMSNSDLQHLFHHIKTT